ncbi:hypothetical protein SJAV_08690 [Sulfurisphaera javensis]|uniref:DUF4064 domain-containing protein n=1 Tax=Sulfurisphaera javensis TaxID=2049879 RepID=A0AAT9GQ11_9CREN
MKRSTASILASIGGAMYIIGGIATGLLIGSLYSFTAGLANSKSIEQQGTSDATFLIVFGFVIGILIILFSILFLRSSNSKMRKIGGALVIILALLGAINTFGGLIIGIIFAIAGGVGAITAKE